MKFELPKIYPITDAGISGLSHAEQIEKMIAGGAVMIQLREKLASSDKFYASAAQAVEIARPSGIKIIINDRVDIALALDADGVHVGQDDLPPDEARKILGVDSIIGFSTHSAEQARLARFMPVDYIAIGPIFQTDTKENPDAVIGLDGLRAARQAVGKIPLVAIGGIHFDNMKSVFAAGADSVALIAAIISDASQIESRTAQSIAQASGK